jgi:type IV secretion system protein VirB10
MPGHYNPRWGERIGAAVLISIMKDVTTAIINNQSNKNGGGTSVVVSPGQNTIQGTGNIADQVIRETLRVRPNVTINEGTRISIYVARDLDFRKVYELRHAAKLAKANRQ